MNAPTNRALGGAVYAGQRTRPAATARIVVLILAALLVAVCSSAYAEPAVHARASLVNKKAPEFALKDINGKNLALHSFRGKVVLLDFWATWCAPCLLEMPVFAKWQQRYEQQGLQVVSISMDDESAPVRKLLAKMKLNYPVAMGDAALGERYGGVLGLPLTYLIDRNGVVRARFQGESDVNTIEKQLKLMLTQH